MTDIPQEVREAARTEWKHLRDGTFSEAMAMDYGRNPPFCLLVGRRQYDDLVKVLPDRELGRIQAQRTVAEAAAQWWQDWSEANG